MPWQELQKSWRGEGVSPPGIPNLSHTHSWTPQESPCVWNVHVGCQQRGAKPTLTCLTQEPPKSSSLVDMRRAGNYWGQTPSPLQDSLLSLLSQSTTDFKDYDHFCTRMPGVQLLAGVTRLRPSYQQGGSAQRHKGFQLLAFPEASSHVQCLHPPRSLTPYLQGPRFCTDA